MAGLNLLRGAVSGGTMLLEDGSAAHGRHRRPGSGAGDHPTSCGGPVPDGPGRAARATSCAARSPASIRKATAGESGSTAPFPLVAEVTPAAAAELRLAEGGEVFAVVKATEIDVYSV